MNRIAVAIAGLALLGLPLAQPSHAQVNVNVNIGVPVPPLPFPGPPVFTLEAPPEFIMPSALGFYVAVGIPQDIFLVGNNYYLYQDRGWYVGRNFNGPWRNVEYRQLPPGLRKHNHERIRYYRDEEYRRYRSDNDGYRGRRFRPEKEWHEDRKEQRREDKEQRKDERRYEKEERKHDKGEGNEHGKHGGHDD